MAQLDIKQGKLADAQARLERGLAIREKVFGASHVENAFSLVWLGELAVDRGQYSEGEALVRRALSLLEREPPDPDRAGPRLRCPGPHRGSPGPTGGG